MNSKLEGTGKRRASQRSPTSSGSQRSPTSSGSQAQKGSPRPSRQSTPPRSSKFTTVPDDIKQKILSFVFNDEEHMRQFRIRNRMFELLKHIFPNLNDFPLLKSSASVALEDIAPKDVDVNKFVAEITKHYASASDDYQIHARGILLEQIKDVINDISDDTIPDIEDQCYIDNPSRFHRILVKFFSDKFELTAIIKCYKLELHYLRMKEEYTSILWKPTQLKKLRIKGGKQRNK